MAYRYPPGQTIGGPRGSGSSGSSVDPNLTVYVNEDSSTKVQISWYLPYRGASYIKLYIYHGHNLEYETNMNGSERQLNLINVTPGKQYTATVVAYYNRGNRASGSKNFRTSYLPDHSLLQRMFSTYKMALLCVLFILLDAQFISAAPLGQKICGPRDSCGTSVDRQLQVNMKELTSTEVKISWCLPYGGARNVKLYIYQGRNAVYEEKMNQTEIKIKDFVPEKLYTATVVAQYYSGHRETGSKSFRTSKLQDALQVGELTSTKVKISWRLSYGGAHSITLYIYDGCNVELEEKMAGDETDITIINITPGKQYSAKVVAQYYGGSTETGSKDFQTSIN